MSLFSRASIVPTDPNVTNAASVIPDEAISRYFQLAIIVLLTYDAVITIDKEVKYFWVLPINSVTAVYFANRYIGLFGAITAYFIDTFKANLTLFAIWSRSVSYWATIVLIDYILMIRVLALYQRDKTVTLLLGSLLTFAAAFKLAFLIFITIYQRVDVYYVAPGISLCGEDRTVAIAWGIADWISPMIYNLILMSFVFYKAGRFSKMSQGFRGSTLIRILIHDQVIYFFLVVSVCVLNILQFKLKVTNDILQGFLSTLGSPSLLCILGSHLLFNLKEAGKEEVVESRSCELKSFSVSKMEFVTVENV